MCRVNYAAVWQRKDLFVHAVVQCFRRTFLEVGTSAPANEHCVAREDECAIVQHEAVAAGRVPWGTEGAQAVLSETDSIILYSVSAYV